MDEQLEQRAEAIFDGLIDVPTVDRPAAARRACAADAALLNRVDALLAALPAAGGFLAEPTGDAAATVGAEADPFTEVPVGEKPGDRIGRYKLLERRLP